MRLPANSYWSDSYWIGRYRIAGGPQPIVDYVSSFSCPNSIVPRFDGYRLPPPPVMRSRQASMCVVSSVGGHGYPARSTLPDPKEVRRTQQDTALPHPCATGSRSNRDFED